VERRSRTAGSSPVTLSHLPRLLFALLWPRRLCAVAAALPPPRSKLVLLGFLPELRAVPGRLPGRAPDFVRAPRPSMVCKTRSDFCLCDIKIQPSALNAFFSGHPFGRLCVSLLCSIFFRDHCRSFYRLCQICSPSPRPGVPLLFSMYRAFHNLPRCVPLCASVYWYIWICFLVA
jgi:hypothetical protein